MQTTPAAKMGDRVTRAEQAAGVSAEGDPSGINWSGFFRNPHVLLQIILYGILFYKMFPSPEEVGPLLVCVLILLPICVLNVIGTHVITELVANRKKRAAQRRVQ